MKNKLSIILFGVAVSSSVYWGAYTSESRSASSPAGRTNAPGETTCTACHSGVLNSGPETFNISAAGNPVGYIPGQTYTIQVDFPVSTRTKHGFIIVALSADSQNVGTFSTNGSVSIKIDTSTSALLAGRRYVTHTTAGNLQKTWTVTWKAPATAVGRIRFFGAGNASNAMGNSAGDNIYTDTLTLSAPTSISSSIFANQKVSVFPNPASNECFVSFDLLRSGLVSMQLVNSLGQIMAQKPAMPLFAGMQQQQFSLANVPSGQYFIKVEASGSSFVKPLVVR